MVEIVALQAVIQVAALDGLLSRVLGMQLSGTVATLAPNIAERRRQRTRLKAVCVVEAHNMASNAVRIAVVFDLFQRRKCLGMR